MSFINWGNESPEQRAIRARLEQEALYEQAARMAQARNRGNNAMFGGAAGGGPRSPQSNIAGTQTALYFFQELDVPTYRYFLLNFNTSTISGPFDTQVSVDDYSLNDLQLETMQYGGYGAKFYRGDINEHTMLFIDVDGNIVQSIVAISTDVTFDDAGGKYIIATDFDAQLIWVFDGTFLLTDTSVFTGVSNFGIGSNESSSCPSGVGVSTQTVDGGNTIYKYYIINGLTATEVFSETRVTGENYFGYAVYHSLDRVLISEYTNPSGTLVAYRVAKADGTGNVYATEIDDVAYPNSGIQFYGTKNFYLFVENGTEMEIYVYDGVRDDVEKITINKVTYPGRNFYYSTYYLSSRYDESPCENLSIIAYNSTGSSNQMEEVTDCKIYTFFSGKLHTEYLFNNKKIHTGDVARCKNFFLYAVDTGTATHSSLVIRNSGAPILTNLGTIVADTSDFDLYEVGESGILKVEYNLATPGVTETIYHSFNSNGVKNSQILELDTPSESTSWNYNVLVASGDGNSNLLNFTNGVWSQHNYVDQLDSSDFYGGQNNLSDPYFYTQIENRIYYFSDNPGPNIINDGGNDMYDGGNRMYTNVSGFVVNLNEIPYTHTAQINNGELAISDFIIDGTIENGASYFGASSQYFTNLYPGMFVAIAKGIVAGNVTEFKIDGDIGTDGNGTVTVDTVTISTGYSKQYTAFIKQVSGTGDPSINQIIIVDTNGAGISQEVDLTSEDDLHRLTGLDGVTEIHYLLTAKAAGVPLSTSEINRVILNYLDIVDGKSIANTLTDLNANYENVTGVLPPNDAPAIAKVFKSGGQTSTFSIPNYDTIRFGKDTIAITYPDPARDNNLTVELRNLNGSLLQKVETPHPVYYDFRNIENRCIFLTENKVFDPMEGAIIYYRNLYLISKNEVKSVAIVSPDTASVRDILNDFAWWND